MPSTTSRAAVDEVHDAGRQVALREQLEHQPLRQRHLLGRLDDDGVAGGDGERQEPQRHHRREVERRDGGDDAERLTQTRRSRRSSRCSRGRSPSSATARRRRPRRTRCRAARCRAIRRCVLPCSVVTVRASSSACASSSSTNRNSARARRTTGVSRQPGNALFAAWTAASRSARVDSGVRAMTRPVAGLWTSAKRRWLTAASWPPTKFSRTSTSVGASAGAAVDGCSAIGPPKSCDYTARRAASRTCSGVQPRPEIPNARVAVRLAQLLRTATS